MNLILMILWYYWTTF